MEISVYRCSAVCTAVVLLLAICMPTSPNKVIRLLRALCTPRRAFTHHIAIYIPACFPKPVDLLKALCTPRRPCRSIANLLPASEPTALSSPFSTPQFLPSSLALITEVFFWSTLRHQLVICILYLFGFPAKLHFAAFLIPPCY